MEEFNISENQVMGTPLSQLNNENKNENEMSVLLSQLKNERNNQEQNYDVLKLIKDIDARLDNIEVSNKSENTVQTNKTKTNIKYKEILLFMLLFLVINNKYVIQGIYCIPYINIFNSSYTNLIIRTLIFGLIVLLLQKYPLF